MVGDAGTEQEANVTVGGLEFDASANILTVAGNVDAAFFNGNGRFLSGIDSTGISNGTSNVRVFEDTIVTVSVAGTANIAEFSDTALSVAGTISADIVNAGTIGNGGAQISGETGTFGTSVLTTSLNANGTATVNSLTSNGAITVNGTEVIDNTAEVITAQLKDSGVAAGTYGDASNIAQIVVDAKGRVTSAVNVAVAGVSDVSYTAANSNLTIGTSSGTNYSVDLGVGTEDTPEFAGLTLTGTLTGTAVEAATVGNAGAAFIGATINTSGTATVNDLTSNGAITVNGTEVIDSGAEIVTAQLKDSGVDSGTYGNASSVPQITVDAKGRVTAVANIAVAGVSDVTYVSANSNLTISTSSGTNYSVDIGVGTADTPEFAGLTLTGTLTGTAIEAATIGNTDSAIFGATVESTGNATVNDITINNSATIGTTLDVTGNLIAGNVSSTAYYYANGNPFIEGSVTTVSNTAPSSPDQGDIWIDTDNGIQFIYFNDGDSSQWVEMEAFQSFSSSTSASNWTEKTSNYDAVNGDWLIVNTASSAITITLNASPVLGDTVKIVDGSGNAATNNITVDRNTKNINGVAANLTIDINRASVELVYYDTTNGWILIGT
jgi:hypothetical protein